MLLLLLRLRRGLVWRGVLGYDLFSAICGWVGPSEPHGGNGWLLSRHCFAFYVLVLYYRGAGVVYPSGGQAPDTEAGYVACGE